MLETIQVGLGALLAANASTVEPSTITRGNTGISGIQPNPAGLPGGGIALTITNGIMFFSLLMCLIGLVLSAGLWAVGAFSNNYTQSVNGKKGFLICAASALAIGAAFFMIEWFFGAGSSLNGTAG